MTEFFMHAYVSGLGEQMRILQWNCVKDVLGCMSTGANVELHCPPGSPKKH